MENGEKEINNELLNKNKEEEIKKEENEKIISEIKNKDNYKDKIDNKKLKTLNELEQEIDYKYNEKGELIHKITGKKVGRLGQLEYELVGCYVEKYIEHFLIHTFNLTTLYVPNNNSTDFTKRDENQAQCKILTTNDFPINPKCLIIIQGAGPVRLGQWARSICINDNLNLGSMIPYVEKAIQNKFSVIILNPNERKDFLDDTKTIEEFSDHEKHSVYVYNNIIKKNKNIKEIYILAHSVGGDCTLEILFNNEEDLLNGRIKKIAFTDSVHGNEYEKLGKKGVNIFRKISRNFICSDKPAGEFILKYNNSKTGIDCYSSGNRKHEYTSGCAIEEVFNFFKIEDKKQCQIF